MKISKEQFQQAQSEKEVVEQALAGLLAIDPVALDYTPDDADELEAAIAVLVERLEIVEEIVTAAGNQYVTRDFELVEGSIHCSLIVAHDIVRWQLFLSNLIHEHNDKIADLLAKGCSPDEAKLICPPPLDKISEIENQIENLKVEEEKLTAFIKSAPIFDESLLDGLDIDLIRQTYRMLHPSKDTANA